MLIVRLISPVVGGSTPLTKRIKVDLPAPLRPKIPTFSPLLSVKLTSFKTSRQPERVG